MKERAKAIDAYQIALTATERRLTARHPLYQIISYRIVFVTEGLAEPRSRRDASLGLKKADTVESRLNTCIPRKQVSEL